MFRFFIRAYKFISSKRPRPLKFVQRFFNIENEFSRLRSYFSPYKFSIIIIISLIAYPLYQAPVKDVFSLPLKRLQQKFKKFKEQDDSFGESLEVFSKLMVQRVLSDKEIQRAGGKYVEELAKQSPVQDSIVKLLANAAQEPEFVHEAKQLTQRIALSLLRDSEIERKTAEFIVNTLQNEEVKGEAANLVRWIFSREEIKEKVVLLFKEGFEDPRLRGALNEALSAGFSEVLNASDTVEKMKMFFIFLLEGDKGEEEQMRNAIDRIVEKVMTKKLEDDKIDEFERAIGVRVDDEKTKDKKIF